MAYERVGDLSRALGQEELAREYYMKDLAIAERLVAADRADYQRELIVSLVKLAEAGGGGQAAIAHLSRALQIATALAAKGRLVAADAGMPDDLRRRLEAARAEDH